MEDWISIANLAKVIEGISNVRWINDCFFNSTVTDSQAVQCSYLILKIKLIFFNGSHGRILLNSLMNIAILVKHILWSTLNYHIIVQLTCL